MFAFFRFADGSSVGLQKHVKMLRLGACDVQGGEAKRDEFSLIKKFLKGCIPVWSSGGLMFLLRKGALTLTCCSD